MIVFIVLNEFFHLPHFNVYTHLMGQIYRWKPALTWCIPWYGTVLLIWFLLRFASNIPHCACPRRLDTNQGHCDHMKEMNREWLHFISNHFKTKTYLMNFLLIWKIKFHSQIPQKFLLFKACFLSQWSRGEFVFCTFFIYDVYAACDAPMLDESWSCKRFYLSVILSPIVIASVWKRLYPLSSFCCHEH